MHLRAVRVDARYAELVVLVARDVRLEEREVVGIARDEREVADLLLSDRSPQIDLARLRDRRLARYGDRLGDATDTELDVDQRRLACGQGDALLLERLEPLKLRGHLVAPQRKQRSAIDAGLVGDHGSGRPRIHVRDGDHHARQGGAAAVADRPFDVSVRRLRLCGRGVRRHERQYRTENCYPEYSQHDVVPSRAAGKSPRPPHSRSEGASPLRLPCTLARGGPMIPAPLVWLSRSARSLLCSAHVNKGRVNHRCTEGKPAVYNCVFRITSIRSETCPGA